MVHLIKIDMEAEKIKIVKYLFKKESWKYGYIRYSIFKRAIKHVTKIKSPYLLRKLFMFLIDEGVFLRQKTLVRSYLYKFGNPHEPRIIKTIHTITFD